MGKKKIFSGYSMDIMSRRTSKWLGKMGDKIKITRIKVNLTESQEGGSYYNEDGPLGTFVELLIYYERK